jgi:cytoskeletal protein RodZ
MSGTDKRNEDELRAAFQQKASEAPRAADVLRAVHAREAAPRVPRRRWLMPAVAGAAAIAIGVPLGIALTHTPSAEKKSSGGGQAEAASGGTRYAESSGAGAQANPEARAAPICTRGNVTVSVQANMLRIKSGGVACQLARVPSVQAAATPGATPPAPAHKSGTLLPGTTATATLRWNGSCAARSDGVVWIDWGAGAVEVHAAGVPDAACGAASVGPLHGLH